MVPCHLPLPKYSRAVHLEKLSRKVSKVTVTSLYAGGIERSCPKNPPYRSFNWPPSLILRPRARCSSRTPWRGAPSSACRMGTVASGVQHRACNRFPPDQRGWEPNKLSKGDISCSRSGIYSDGSAAESFSALCSFSWPETAIGPISLYSPSCASLWTLSTSECRGHFRCGSRQV